MSQHTSAPRFDARPLTEPVDPRAAKAYHRQISGGRTAAAVVNTIISVVLVGALLAGTLPVIISALRGEFTPGLLVPAVIVVVVAAFVVIGMIQASRSTLDYRLHNFAQANGMVFEPDSIDPGLPGMIFGIGRQRGARRRLRGLRPRFVEFGNYQYTTGSGKNSTTHHWGYIAIHLDTPLPHIVLDAKGNNGMFGTNLPASFDKDQRLGLEGNFNEFFDLYCPNGYERDALYLFTPDIMARFIDNAAQLDAEIVDDWLFLYAKRDFATDDPKTWAWLFSVVSALMDKLAQWERWRDERLAQQGTAVPAARAHASPGAHSLPFQHDEMVTPPAAPRRPPKGVAQPGQRLTRRSRWWLMLLFILAAIGFGIVQSTGLFGR